MRIKIWSLTVLLLAGISCGSQTKNSNAFKLPSGKEIKVTGIGKMDFPNSDPALVLNYQTDSGVRGFCSLTASCSPLTCVLLTSDLCSRPGLREKFSIVASATVECFKRR